MNAEDAMSFAIMFVGLGFFLLITFLILMSFRDDQDRIDRRNQVQYDRRVREKREFGYDMLNRDDAVPFTHHRK